MLGNVALRVENGDDGSVLVRTSATVGWIHDGAQPDGSSIPDGKWARAGLEFPRILQTSRYSLARSVNPLRCNWPL